MASKNHWLSDPLFTILYGQLPLKTQFKYARKAQRAEANRLDMELLARQQEIFTAAELKKV